MNFSSCKNYIIFAIYVPLISANVIVVKNSSKTQERFFENNERRLDEFHNQNERRLDEIHNQKLLNYKLTEKLSKP